MSGDPGRLITVSTITTDYKMHFPKEVAEQLGVKPGTKIVWYVTARGDVLVRKA